jgi:hypothetical protein
MTGMRFLIYYWSRLQGYLLAKLVEGLDFVSVVSCEPATALDILRMVGPGADAVILHIDQTFDDTLIPPVVRHLLVGRLNEVGIRVLNGAVADISKRTIHRHSRRIGLPDPTAGPPGDDDELLIVKTDLNCGGNPEHYFGGRPRGPVISGPADYRILPRGEVPPDWWAAGGLCIERFIGNAEDEFYRFHLLGDRAVLSEARSEHAIKRLDGTCPQVDHCTDLDEISAWTPGGPESWAGAAWSAATFARTFGLDYGAIDVLRDDQGHYYVIDVNKTPYWGADIENAITTHLRSWLSPP